MTSHHVVFEDQTLRDGLQIEGRIFRLEEKIDIFHALRSAGFTRIQVGSFVHPKWVPQMADTEELVNRLIDTPGVMINGLILNEKGLYRALGCGLKHLSMSVSASDAHSRKNANRPAREALSQMADLIAEAVGRGVKVRAGVQCSFGCVYEGSVDQGRVIEFAETMVKAGATEVNLADTTGMATPLAIRNLITKARERLPEVDLVLHLHDTRGLGLVNMLAGYEVGVTVFDVCVGGLGGCPFVKGAAGNVAAEDAAYLFESMGISTGLDLRRMCSITTKLEGCLGRRLPAKMGRIVKAGQPLLDINA